MTRPAKREPEAQIAVAAEEPYVSPMDAHEAEMADRRAALAAEFQAGRITKHEVFQQLMGFETEGVTAHTPADRWQHTPSADRAGARKSPEKAVDDGLMSSYVTEETKAEQRAAEAERERQRGGRSGGMER